MSTKKIIEDLILSDGFQKIMSHQNKFNLFKALHISRRELTHSNLIAYFLDPNETHGCEEKILRAFFKCLYANSTNNKFLTFEEYVSLNYKNAKIYREYSNIDILIDLKESSAVIGIENKIDHDERFNQLSDYQRTIERDFYNYKIKKIIFLTPHGIKSTTHNKESSVDHTSISYMCLSKALYESLQFCYDDKVKAFIRECITHIEEDIMDNGEKRNLIANIWKNYDYAKAIKNIYEGRPVFSNLEENYKNKVIELIKQKEKSKVNFTTYPTRGELQEIKFTIKNWTEKNYKYEFMFYYKGYLPAVRVLVYSDQFEKSRAAHENLAALNEELFDKNFPKIKGWNAWRKVFIEDDYPDNTFIEDLSFSDSTVDAALSIIQQKLSILSEYINKA